MSPTATPPEAVTAVWTTDFKGQFPTGDGVLCYPLTVADGASRSLLACRAPPSVRTSETRPMFERLFQERGLPERIRSDNGHVLAGESIAVDEIDDGLRRSPSGPSCWARSMSSSSPSRTSTVGWRGTTEHPATRNNSYRCPQTDVLPMSLIIHEDEAWS